MLAAWLLVGCGAKAEPVPGEQPTDLGAPDPQSHLERSLALEQAGDLAAAFVEAEAAVAAGGGRDAVIHAAKLAILRKDHDTALAFVRPLVEADPTDAVALYNLALAHQHKGDYNEARNGYLAALKTDPKQADARYNLAVLCFDRGIHEEARHHAARFRSSFADDPRGPALEHMVGGLGAASPSAVPVP